MFIKYKATDNLSVTLLSNMLICLLLLSTTFLSACNQNEDQNSKSETMKEEEQKEEKEAKEGKAQETETEQQNLEETNEIVISAVGDVMVHGPQLEAQYDSEKNEYDFNDNFEYIKPYIDQADLALANLETVLAGGERGYSGYPMFNSPDVLADALKNSGFNVLSTANNHSLDQGEAGLRRTVEVLEDRGLKAIGTKKQAEDDSYLIKEIEGIKIGLSAFTYETPRIDGQRTINGIPMSDKTAELIDSFNYDELNQDMEDLTERAEHLQDQGADVIAFFMHWGTEYERQPNEYQEKIAEELVDSGVDIIFGSHPHVVQPVEEIKTPSGEEGIVIYSMGNFLSNQRREYLDRPYTEDGVIMHVTIEKDAHADIEITETAYTPTWVHKYRENEERNYEIVPLPDALEHEKIYNLHTEESVNRAQQSLENTNKILTTDDSFTPEHIHSLFPPQD
ncbi:CapA family protein [Natranaerobius thermophilus]|uniref:CapA domain protein n=1 Tax=Natranaerobius thermophilus (strain ATCC BAA-1301 / DSM 18059 / JW/NM-WN-LF) TaxID=457570 RepID=B2A7C2_NATTJ|nr:CapA family protein [Natranaerobius thermophilus]ACB84316.1 CapA domain protein [Natranaerobius thermophilus JW/NM-WN-LF]